MFLIAHWGEVKRSEERKTTKTIWRVFATATFAWKSPTRFSFSFMLNSHLDCVCVQICVAKQSDGVLSSMQKKWIGTANSNSKQSLQRVCHSKSCHFFHSHAKLLWVFCGTFQCDQFVSLAFFPPYCIDFQCSINQTGMNRLNKSSTCLSFFFFQRKVCQCFRHAIETITLLLFLLFIDKIKL